MKGIIDIFSRFDYKIFRKYFLVSVLLILVIIGLSKVRFTSAKYEIESQADITPSFAFFITDVSTQSASIKLDNIVPSNEPHLYAFTVSNFKDNKKANVDLNYTIEVITTTNLPLNFKLFKNPDFTNEHNFVESIVQNNDNVYFRHLLFQNTNVMSYRQAVTDTFTLWIEFPLSYSNEYDNISGVMELIDVEVKAEQVVGV